MSHPPHCIPGAGWVVGEGSWWYLAWTMWPCSALHTSLESPVCSLPCSSISFQSTVIPTSFISTVSCGTCFPWGLCTSGKSVCVHENMCFHVCVFMCSTPNRKCWNLCVYFQDPVNQLPSACFKSLAWCMKVKLCVISVYFEFYHSISLCDLYQSVDKLKKKCFQTWGDKSVLFIILIISDLLF